MTSAGRTRSETDSFGPIDVPAERYWGAQTERSRQNFRIGDELMPLPIIKAFGVVKRAAAEANRDLKSLDARRAKAIIAVADEIIARQARRSVPAGGLADGIRHPDQHECKRGDCEPRQRAPGWQTRRQIADLPQRSRQYEPVVERLLSNRHAHCGSRGNNAPADSGADPLARGISEKDQRLRADRQDRPHPHCRMRPRSRSARNFPVTPRR